MTHSWEIAQARKNSCVIAVVVPPGGVSFDWALSFKNLEVPDSVHYMKLAGLPWGEARTMAANECLNGGFQWLFQLDADIVLPKNTLTKLMGHQLPIVAGLYHQRFPTWNGAISDYQPCMFKEVVGDDGKIGMKALTEYQPGDLVEADYVGAGCLLIHRSVFERMLQAGIKRFFEWTMHADSEPQGSGRSEDFEFCSRARQVGFRAFVDTSIVCSHETVAQVNVKGLVPKL